MKFLLDTHVFLWFIGGDAKLPAEWRDAIRQPHHEVSLSVVSLWEAIIKYHLGKLLGPLTRWMKDGIIVGDGGYLSQAKAKELAARGVYLLTPTRKNMRHLASPFQLACLQLRHRVEELFEFLKCAFGAVRTTHRAPHALPIHLLCWLLAYSLYKSLFV